MKFLGVSTGSCDLCGGGEDVHRYEDADGDVVRYCGPCEQAASGVSR